MNVYQIISLIMTLLGVPTIVGLIIKDRYDKKKSEKQHIAEMQSREDKRVLEDQILDIFKENTSIINQKLDNLESKITLSTEGTLSVLRNDLLKSYYLCVDKGYRNDYDCQNFLDMYQAYINLGGNSFIIDIKTRFERLPHKEEYKKQTPKQDKE